MEKLWQGEGDYFLIVVGLVCLGVVFLAFVERLGVLRLKQFIELTKPLLFSL